MHCRPPVEPPHVHFSASGLRRQAPSLAVNAVRTWRRLSADICQYAPDSSRPAGYLALALRAGRRRIGQTGISCERWQSTPRLVMLDRSSTPPTLAWEWTTTAGRPPRPLVHPDCPRFHDANQAAQIPHSEWVQLGNDHVLDCLICNGAQPCDWPPCALRSRSALSPTSGPSATESAADHTSHGADALGKR